MMETAEIEQLVTRPEAAASNSEDAGSNPALCPQIQGAIYLNDVLQPGCMICRSTIPERQAKFRAKACDDECAKALRTARRKNLMGSTPLYCQVCRGLIPPATAKKLGVTCGLTCRTEMRRYRFQILKTQKCPHCYHPSSPAEWEDYRQWRASRGPMQAFMQLPGRGNLASKRESELRKALVEAVAVAQEEMRRILDGGAMETMEGVKDPGTLEGIALQDYEKLSEQVNRWQALASLKKKVLDMEGAG